LQELPFPPDYLQGAWAAMEWLAHQHDPPPSSISFRSSPVSH
jgi:hypothetical protein